ncbi:MAG TPA: hypothetical protein PLY05_12465 [Agitococcus sp.]|nr:hypothetical protein [Agitococcus sp.]
MLLITPKPLFSATGVCGVVLFVLVLLFVELLTAGSLLGGVLDVLSPPPPPPQAAIANDNNVSINGLVWFGLVWFGLVWFAAYNYS